MRSIYATIRLCDTKRPRNSLPFNGHKKSGQQHSPVPRTAFKALCKNGPLRSGVFAAQFVAEKQHTISFRIVRSLTLANAYLCLTLGIFKSIWFLSARDYHFAWPTKCERFLPIIEIVPMIIVLSCYCRLRRFHNSNGLGY